MIVTDASPQGCGGMLLIRASLGTPWKVLKAYEYPVEPVDASLLGFMHKSHKGQGFLEALAAGETPEQLPDTGYGRTWGHQSTPLSRLMGRRLATEGNETTRTWPYAS